MTNQELAQKLRELADELDSGSTVTLSRPSLHEDTETCRHSEWDHDTQGYYRCRRHSGHIGNHRPGPWSVTS